MGSPTWMFLGNIVDVISKSTVDFELLHTQLREKIDELNNELELAKTIDDELSEICAFSHNVNSDLDPDPETYAISEIMEDLEPYTIKQQSKGRISFLEKQIKQLELTISAITSLKSIKDQHTKIVEDGIKADFENLQRHGK